MPAARKSYTTLVGSPMASITCFPCPLLGQLQHGVLSARSTRDSALARRPSSSINTLTAEKNDGDSSDGVYVVLMHESCAAIVVGLFWHVNAVLAESAV